MSATTTAAQKIATLRELAPLCRRVAIVVNLVNDELGEGNLFQEGTPDFLDLLDIAIELCERASVVSDERCDWLIQDSPPGQTSVDAKINQVTGIVKMIRAAAEFEPPSEFKWFGWMCWALGGASELARATSSGVESQLASLIDPAASGRPRNACAVDQLQPEPGR
jgi:hypothetical protein